MTLADKHTVDGYFVCKEIIKSLRPLCRLDNYHWILAILSDYLIIAFAIYLSVGISFWFYPISLFLIASSQRALANILHESTHSTLAKSKILNYIGGTYFSGYLIFHLFSPYSHSHIHYHHVYTGHSEKDPDYKFHIKCGLYDENQSDTEFFWKNLILTLSGYRTVSYISYVIRDRIKIPLSNKENKKWNKELFYFPGYWLLIISALLYYDLFSYFFLFWIVPLFTFTVTIGWLIELAEHYPLPESEDEALLLTRNRKGVFCENFFFARHYDNYHLIHHLHPGIPHWNMKKAHLQL